jgi:apolipoprotein N-acyltransferase
MEKRTKKWAGIVAGLLLLVLGIGTYTAMAHPPQPEGNVRAFQGAVVVSLSAVDQGGSGVNYTSIAVYYRPTTQAQWTVLLAKTNYTGNITYSTQGRYQVHYYSEDNAKNIEAEKVQTFIIWQDTSSPVTSITLSGNEILPG